MRATTTSAGPTSTTALLTAVTLVAALAAGCTGDDPATAGPGAGDRATDGPLTVSSSAGGMAFLAPRPTPKTWIASQGSFGLCTSGDPVTLEGIRFQAKREPLSVTPWLVSNATGPYSTFGSVLGSPPDFAQPYGDGLDTLRGTYTDGVAGAVIDEPCPDKGVKDGYSELVVAVETTAAGTDIRRLWLDYTVDDQTYTAAIDWRIILCGTEVTTRCGPPDD